MTQFTDANDFEKTILKNFPQSACNEFAWSYAAAHENVVVKVAEMEGGNEHCYVYDAGLNLTIDPTLGQFDGLEGGYWEGDEHPHAIEAWDEWTDKEAFDEHYDGPYSPFIV